MERAWRAAGRRCRCRCRCPTALQRVALSASSGPTRAIAEILRKGGVVLLHPGCGRCVPISHCAVDHVKACLSLVQPQLKAGAAAPREVLRPPFNVEDAVGRTATYRGEYAKPGIDQIQVVPIWVDRVIVGEPRQTDVGKGCIRRHELRIAVGREIDAGKALVVQRVREWQRDGGHRIIPVIADISRAWYDTSTDL